MIVGIFDNRTTIVVMFEILDVESYDFLSSLSSEVKKVAVGATFGLGNQLVKATVQALVSQAPFQNHPQRQPTHSHGEVLNNQ